MSSTNSGYGSRASNRYWLRGTRTFIARRLIAGGNRLGDLAEWVAPWLQKPDPAKPPARTHVHYGDYETHDPLRRP